MNAPERLPLPDIQSTADLRSLPIQRVGIRGVRHPMRARSIDGTEVMTVATADMYVGLAAEHKGTHMSRFIEILERHGRDLSSAGFAEMFDRMLERLEATTGYLELLTGIAVVVMIAAFPQGAMGFLLQLWRRR